MINIKIFPKRRNTAATTSQSSSSSSTSGTTSPTNDWFYLNTDNGFVTCRYPFASVDNIVAFASGTEAGGGSGGGSNIDVIDNLESTSTEDALSANMGRNLKALIDNIQTSSGGGGTATSIDWQNIQNKPSTFPPSAHTHEKTEINGLSDSLANLAAMQSLTQQAVLVHANNNDIHVTAAEKNIISQLTLEQIQFIVRLMQICTIDSSGNITFNGNVNASGNVTAMV